MTSKAQTTDWLIPSYKREKKVRSRKFWREIDISLIWIRHEGLTVTYWGEIWEISWLLADFYGALSMLSLSALITLLWRSFFIISLFRIPCSLFFSSLPSPSLLRPPFFQNTYLSWSYVQFMFWTTRMKVFVLDRDKNVHLIILLIGNTISGIVGLQSEA